ncbi:LHFPL tetraspan subfamily member 6 protein-like [Phymastichus coffea]|uniref:LHFPL tetraspan subfamily member 6 protein-like n=1 Tax=Phymastichus coffea TaxID=108790 RepID=UPI00273AD5C6|nr:LHFPL tetraspan subfamily member 6 protein-like [Phymastichus coffea]
MGPRADNIAGSEAEKRRTTKLSRDASSRLCTMAGLYIVWVALSTLASILACAGFYLPYWIQGKLLGKADAYFSSFRRCNYPRIRPPRNAPEIVYECARYSSFWDIPSPWWQASTVTMSFGLAFAVIGTLTLLAAAVSFLPHVLKSPRHTRLLGSLQLVAATMICGGLIMYPVGWDNREVRESCGKGANVYNLGRCSVSWSSYLLISSIALLLLCFGLSLCAARHKPNPEDPLRI